MTQVIFNNSVYKMIQCVVFLLFTSCFVSSEFNETWVQNVRIRRQSDSKKCLLPPYPKNGQYTVGGQSSGRPGERYDAVQLLISCDPGYQPLGSNITYCVNGDWFQGMPRCVRHCRLDPHPSVRYRCLVNPDGSEDVYYRNCEQHEPPGTIVKPECNKPNYYYPGGVFPNMRCIEGGWDMFQATCLPECGTKTPKGKPYIIGGREVKRGEFPWHAGIYLTTTTPFKLICGGSLVSSAIVISAAHCFYDQNQPRPASDFAIALGKVHREWNNQLDDEAQKFDIKDVKIPVRYQSSSTNYQDDIAAAILSRPAQYRPHIRPVCLDMDPYFNAQQLRDGNLGKVTGWGLIDSQGSMSPVLKVLELPYVKIETCIEEAPSEFRSYITSDKICAGYLNGSAICKGDSGGGLVFPEIERAKERYYLRGIVSTAPLSNNACNAFARTSFTEIIKHTDFIEQLFGRSSALAHREAEPLCTLPPYPANGRYQLSGSPEALPGHSFLSAQLKVTCDEGYRLEKDVSPSCSAGRWDEDVPKCVEVPEASCTIPSATHVIFECFDQFFTGRSCKDVEPSKTLIRVICASRIEKIITYYPKIVQCRNGKLDGDLECDDSENCGLVKRSSNFAPWVALVYKKQLYKCGATIINRINVITAVQCLERDVSKDLSDFNVVAGTTHRKWGDLRDDAYRQTSKIGIVKVTTENDRDEQTNDVALIHLSTPLQFNDGVQPACMPLSFSVFDPSTWTNKVGTTASWSMDDVDKTSLDPAELKQVAVEYVEAGTCRTEIGQIPKDTTCFRTDARVCRNDLGMGLMYQVEGHYILAGYATTTFGSNTCSEDKQLTGFKLISKAY